MPTKKVVLDTSVIIKWFHQAGEEDIDAALLLRDTYLNGALNITVPDLLIYEFANALRFKAKLNEDNTSQMVKNLWALGIAIHPIDQSLISSIVSTAYRYEITIYDATFIALASYLPATFITADRMLYEKTRSNGGIILLTDLIE